MFYEALKNFFTFFRNSRTAKFFAVSLPIGLGISYQYSYNKNKWLNYFGMQIDLQTNKINQRISSVEYPANNPVEDRVLCSQLKQIDGYFSAIFDGHGGWQIANYLKNNFNDLFEEELRKNKLQITDKQQLIKTSVKNVIRDTEQKFLKLAQLGNQMGFDQINKQGCCMLMILVSDSKLYTINLGDSQAVIVSEEQRDSEYLLKKNYLIKVLNRKNNANNQKQKAELIEKFPLQKDIIVCKKKNNCYVKGLLQPTATIGDYCLKYNHLKHTNIQKITTPYIKNQPQINVMDIQPKHKYVILGSDGLWNQVNFQQVESSILSSAEDGKDLSQQLLDNSLANISRATNKSYQEVKRFPVGARTKIHDDISIVVINLENQQ